MNWERTRATLAEYDRTSEALDRLLDAAETDADIVAWRVNGAAALIRVQDAFYDDCVEQGVPNSRDHCRVVDIGWLRELTTERSPA